MAIKKKKLSAYKLFINLFFICFSLLCILPFVLLVMISLSNEIDIRNGGYQLIPAHFSTAAYSYIFSDLSALIKAYGVTAFSAFAGSVLGVALMASVGYSLSRDTFLLKKPVTIYLLITMLFSGGLIPSYIINTKMLHLGDSVWAYLFISIFSAYTVFVFRTFFSQLPKSLIESACLDGASEWQIMTRIMFPLSKPVLATFGFMNIVSRWNEFEIPLYYMTKPALYNLQFLLQNILNEAKFLEDMSKTMGGAAFVDIAALPTETMKFAMCILAAGPMILIFPFFQKYFSKGMVVGAVKG